MEEVSLLFHTKYMVIVSKKQFEICSFLLNRAPSVN